MLHIPWDSPLVRHLPTSWWSVWHLFCFWLFSVQFLKYHSDCTTHFFKFPDTVYKETWRRLQHHQILYSENRCDNDDQSLRVWVPMWPHRVWRHLCGRQDRLRHISSRCLWHWSNITEELCVYNSSFHLKKDNCIRSSSIKARKNKHIVLIWLTNLFLPRRRHFQNFTKRIVKNC